MASITVDSDELRVDAATFQGWSDQLASIWSDGVTGLQLTSDDFGTGNDFAEFGDSFSQALVSLSNYFVGGDDPLDPGGVGALACFSRVLTQTATVCDQAAADAEAAVAKVG